MYYNTGVFRLKFIFVLIFLETSFITSQINEVNKGVLINRFSFFGKETHLP